MSKKKKLCYGMLRAKRFLLQPSATEPSAPQPYTMLHVGNVLNSV